LARYEELKAVKGSHSFTDDLVTQVTRVKSFLDDCSCFLYILFSRQFGSVLPLRCRVALNLCQ
jgi:hypothetical protein